RNDPNSSKITIRAKSGQTDVPMACSVDIGRAITKPKRTRELEARVPAPVPVTFCLGLWQLVRRSPVRWWLRLWAYRLNALRSRWRETWILRGTLGRSKDVPVGFERIHLRFDIASAKATPRRYTRTQAGLTTS